MILGTRISTSAVAAALVWLSLAGAGPTARAGWGYGQAYVRSGGYYPATYGRPVHYRSLLVPRSYSPALRYNYAGLRYAAPLYYAAPAYYSAPLRTNYAAVSYGSSYFSPYYAAPYAAPYSACGPYTPYAAPVIYNYSYSAPQFYNCSTPRYFDGVPAACGGGIYNGPPSYQSYGYVPGFVNYDGPPFAADDVPFYVSLTTDDPDTAQEAAQSVGWRLLAEGRYTDAVSAFAYDSEQEPERGEPRIGYALGAAARGDLASGVWAMRRACRYEPAALEQIDLDDRLRPKLRELVGKYAASDVGRSDAAFMTAALHLLLGDRPEARRAVEGALQSGDYSQSTRGVQQLLGGADE